MPKLMSWILALVIIATACQSDSAQLAFDQVLVDAIGTDDVEAYRYQIERDAERLMTECMADAGFEFVVPRPTPPGPSESDLASPAFAEKNGFGIILTFREWIDGLDVEAHYQDPNREYLTTLTGAEIDRYLTVLNGEEPEPGQLPDNAGCRGSAAEQAYGRWNRLNKALPNYPGLAEERDTHPDWIAARVEWRECMIDSGFDYHEPEEIRSDVESRMYDTVNSAYPDGRLPLVEIDGTWELDPEVDPLLEELLQFEVDAALANLACTEPLAASFRAVESEIQQDFVDRNRAAIDELLAGG